MRNVADTPDANPSQRVAISSDEYVSGWWLADAARIWGCTVWEKFVPPYLDTSSSGWLGVGLDMYVKVRYRVFRNVTSGNGTVRFRVRYVRLSRTEVSG